MLRLKCKRHPRYDGERSPRASCDYCLELYRIRCQAVMSRLVIVTSKKTVREAQEA
jgi:hypothetical protein